MAELLLELFSEEIPARMQRQAAEELRRLLGEGLKARGLAVGETRAYATPRRLVVIAEGVPEASPRVVEERKGPRVNAPPVSPRGRASCSSEAGGAPRSRARPSKSSTRPTDGYSRTQPPVVRRTSMPR